MTIRKRRITVKGTPETAQTASQRATKTAVRYIRKHPQFDFILSAIRAGTPNGDIADFCIERGYFDVNRKTAVSYLNYFRREYPEMCRPMNPDSDPNPNSVATYDHLFNGNGLMLNEKTELIKLIQLQKARIAIDFTNERAINKLFASNNKEVQILKELLVELAKLNGTISSSTQVNVYHDENVRSELHAIKQDESQRNLIATMVNELIQVSA